MSDRGPPRLGDILSYRPYRGIHLGPWRASLAISRYDLTLIFGKWLFWGLYLLGLLVFFLYFFGQYLLVWAGTLNDGQVMPAGPFGRIQIKDLVDALRGFLKMDGSPETFRNFLQTQGSIVMVVFALAGAQLIGNDFRFRSFPFYFSKPIRAHHYLFAKGLSAAVLLNLLTTLPALVLFFESYVLGDWQWSMAKLRLLMGIMGYGLVLTLGLVPIFLAASSGLTRTIPIAMFWIFVFIFLRGVGVTLTERLRLSNFFKLIDLWNDLNLIGNRMLGAAAEANVAPFQPPVWSAFLTLAVLGMASLIYLRFRLGRVEVVR